ncbi:MAG: hypothetical protein ACI9BH_001187 [Paracoccaceae bacterium]|jgi:hypothetical protein
MLELAEIAQRVAGRIRSFPGFSGYCDLTLSETGFRPYIYGMKQSASLAFAVALLSVPAVAQEQDPPSLMQRGAEMFFEGLREEMAPALDNLQDLAQQAGPSLLNFMTEMGPAFTELLDEVQDWSRYSAPEILPNGNIIIRLKPDADPKEPNEDEIDI